MKPGTVCRLMTQQFAVNPGLTEGQWLRQAYTSGPGHRSIDEALKNLASASSKNSPFKPEQRERTRLQLAGLWLAEADLLLLDEPTNHLDMENLQWLQGYINDSPDTIIMVSHDRYFLDQTVHMVFELHPCRDNLLSRQLLGLLYGQAEKLALDTKLYLHQEKQARKLQEAINLQKQWAGKSSS